MTTHSTNTAQDPPVAQNNSKNQDNYNNLYKHNNNIKLQSRTCIICLKKFIYNLAT